MVGSSISSSHLVDGVVILVGLLGIIWLAAGLPRGRRPNLPRKAGRPAHLTHRVIAAGLVAGSAIYLRHILLIVVIALVAGLLLIFLLRSAIRWERRRVRSHREDQFLRRAGEDEYR